MDEPEFAIVTLRVKLQDTVGEFKKAVAEEAQNLFSKNKKFENNAEKLVDVGLGPDSVITNNPISEQNKMFFGRFPVNSFVNLAYGLLNVVRIPRIQEDPNSSLRLFSLPLRPGFEGIINELDVLSFVRLASTCKWLRSFSLSNSAIRVKFEATIDVAITWNRLPEYFPRIFLNFDDCYVGTRTVTGILLKNLQKLPLELYTELKFNECQQRLTSPILSTVSGYIGSFRRIHITKVSVDRGIQVTCWPEFLDFLEAHSINDVRLKCPNTMSDEQFESILLMDLKFLEFEGHLSRKMYRRMKIDGLLLRQSGLTVNEFKEILELLADGKMNIKSVWGFENIHADFAEPETFRRCFLYFKHLPYDYENVLPETRPIVSEDIGEEEEEQKQVYLLNERSKVFRIRFEPAQNNIQIHYEDKAENYEGPEMFRRFVE